MKTKFTEILLTIVLLITIGCSADKKEGIATIDENFRRYFSKAFKKNVDVKLNYYVLDMEGCSDCIEEHFGYLDSLQIRNDVVFIIAGKVNKQEWVLRLKELRLKNDLLIDDSKLAKTNYFGLNKPLFLKYDNTLKELVSVKTPVSNQILKEVFVFP